MKNLSGWWAKQRITMKAAIVGAVIGGVFLLIATLLQLIATLLQQPVTPSPVVVVTVPTSPLLTVQPLTVSPVLPTNTPTSTATYTPVPPTETATNTPTPTRTPTIVCVYDFEAGTAGWVHQTHPATLAIIAVAQSDKQAKSGKFSLEMTTVLDGKIPNKRIGEAYVDIFDPSTGERTSINLEGVPITVWIYAPKGAIGDAAHPNGAAVFARDSEARGEYGPWVVIIEDTWFKVQLTPSRVEPSGGGYMDKGFDPTNIVRVGVKIGVGRESIATYNGPIYVDAFGWCPP